MDSSADRSRQNHLRHLPETEHHLNVLFNRAHLFHSNEWSYRAHATPGWDQSGGGAFPAYTYFGGDIDGMYDTWQMGRLLQQEIGHTLGLHHVYALSVDQSQAGNPNFLCDVFGASGPYPDPYKSNNVMEGQGDSWISGLQAATMHRYLTTGLQAALVSNVAEKSSCCSCTGPIAWTAHARHTGAGISAAVPWNVEFDGSRNWGFIHPHNKSNIYVVPRSGTYAIDLSSSEIHSPARVAKPTTM